MEFVSNILVEKFECLADKCPNTCCQQWEIEVDEDTWGAWNRRPEAARRALVTSVSTIPSPDGSRKLVLKKRDDGFCPLLQSDGLCSVQQQYGHDFLPKACRDYPRYKQEFRGRRISAINYSCPQVVQLLLDARDQHPRDFFIWDGSMETSGDESDLYRLEPMFFQLMDEDATPIGVRLYWLYEVMIVLADAFLVNRLDGALVRKQCKITGKGIRKALKLLEAKQARGQLRPNLAQTGQLWETLFTGLWPMLQPMFGDRLAGSPTFQLLVERAAARKADSSGDPKHWRVTGNHILKAVRPLAPRYQSALEAYLASRLVYSGFSRFSNMVANSRAFQSSTLILAIVELFLWCHVEVAGYLDDEAFVDIVHRIDRRLGTNQPIGRLMEECPHELGLQAGQQMALMLG